MPEQADDRQPTQPAPGGGDAVPQNWWDGQFSDMPLVVLISFAFCCGPVALVFAIAGLFRCVDPQARRNALIVTCICLGIYGVNILAQLTIVFLSKT